MRRRLSRAVTLLACFAVACGGDDDSKKTEPETMVTPAPPGAPYDTLGEWNLFADALGHEPAHRVVPYEVASPLFTDFTSKHRFLWIPEGTVVAYDDDAVWGFPVGTILIKTFAYLADVRDPQSGERVLETRLLVRDTEAEWSAHTYVWDEAQTEAVRKAAGDTIDTSFIGLDGDEVTIAYGVPNTNQCRECHGEGSELGTLGGRTRQLDRDNDYGKGAVNQLDHLSALGLFDREPAPREARTRLIDPAGTGDFTERVRSYLDANCGHCHAPDRFAASSALWVDYEHTDFDSGNPTDWGVCKAPTSAGGATCGLTFDIVPGDPDSSILVCRMASVDPQVRMPPLGTKLAHTDGVALISEWIRGMSPAGCQ